MIIGFKIKHYPEMTCFQIGTETEQEAIKLKEKIHNKLCGREDYKNCGVVLNGFDDCKEETPFDYYVNIFCDNENMDSQSIIVNIFDKEAE